ncbi:hypothetical protein ACI68E_000295 [Malassezia pachydermatis]|uniref:Uncharacterized protein n=1 Tax=Malassezia pachydermatis TaxID=77020 RepID=A0A0M8MRY0_9BASI|nr:hypothetical protein Malapachy_2148 [Malassezia pachydermatis]KOS15557.1 hypothetical protein Malapachy_2148 [Malassezia pachydermatis]
MRHLAFDSDEAPISRLEKDIQDSIPVQDVFAVTVSFAELDNRRCRRLLDSLRASWAALPRSQAEAYDRKMRGIRRLDLSSNHITSFREAGLMEAVQSNFILRQLELQGNELVVPPHSDTTDEIQAWAQAVGSSGLRMLNMTANQLGDVGMAAFFDTLAQTGSPLHTLYMSVNTFESESGSLKAALSIARFLSDPKACRGLECLHLNGNHFGWAGVRIIAHAIMGSRRACTLGGTLSHDTPTEMLDMTPPNTSLVHIDLFSTGIDSLASTTEAPVWAPWEAYSAVTQENWFALVTQQLEENERRRDQCRHVAARILTPARIVGCKAREASETTTSSTFPFLRLPIELRALVLEALDPAHVLSHEQWVHIVQWASEPSTLGYGHDPAHTMKICTESPLPSPIDWPMLPWSWELCFQERSQRRNWYMESLEQQEGDELRTPMPPALLAFWECTGTDHAEAVSSFRSSSFV